MIINRRPVDRRYFLRGTGAAAIGLPFLQAMGPTLGQRVLAATPPDQSPKRFVAMCATLGFHTPYLFPETEGRDYKLTPYLSHLKDHRDQLTVLSGLVAPESAGQQWACLRDHLANVRTAPWTSGIQEFDLARPSDRRSDWPSNTLPVFSIGNERAKYVVDI